jgi:hypothetical protein
MGHVKIESTFDIEYYLERRRYGTPSNPRWFVWLLWRRISANPQKQWNSFGDPWQKVTPNKKELTAALAQIRFQYLVTPGGLSGTANPGTLVKLNTGADARVIDKTEKELIVVLMSDEQGKEYTVPPSAVAYII